MCSYKICFSYLLSLLQKTQGRKEETWIRTWYLGSSIFLRNWFLLLLFPLLSSIRYITRSLSPISEMQRHTASSEWEGTLLGREAEDTRLPLSGGGKRCLGMWREQPASSGIQARSAEQTPQALSPVTRMCSAWNKAQPWPPAAPMVQLLQSKEMRLSKRGTHGPE